MEEKLSERDVSDIDNPEVAHETTDVNVRAIIGFGVALVIAAAVIHVIVWLMFDFFGSLNNTGYPREFPMAARSGEIRLPPVPRLQEKPREEMKALRREEDDLLGGYTWINQQTGAVRVPIADAMKQVVEQGFPVIDRPEAARPALPADSSSGRTTEPAPGR